MHRRDECRTWILRVRRVAYFKGYRRSMSVSIVTCAYESRSLSAVVTRGNGWMKPYDLSAHRMQIRFTSRFCVRYLGRSNRRTSAANDASEVPVDDKTGLRYMD